MRRVGSVIWIVLWTGIVAGQDASVPRKVIRVILEGRVSTIRLSSLFITTVRLPEPVSSVVVGDPNLFQAEHSDNEPMLVFVKPTTPAVVETNLLITTTGGRQFPLVLKNGEVAGSHSVVDLLVVCRVANTSFIEETYSSSLVAETVGPGSTGEKLSATPNQEDPISRLLETQRKRGLSRLEGNRLRVGLGQIIERGSQFIVLGASSGFWGRSSYLSCITGKVYQ